MIKIWGRQYGGSEQTITEWYIRICGVKVLKWTTYLHHLQAERYPQVKQNNVP